MSTFDKVATAYGIAWMIVYLRVVWVSYRDANIRGDTHVTKILDALLLGFFWPITVTLMVKQVYKTFSHNHRWW